MVFVFFISASLPASISNFLLRYTFQLSGCAKTAENKKIVTVENSINFITQRFNNSVNYIANYHFNNALAQVKPLPNAARQTRSPSLIFCCSQASHKAMGIDAAVVFPYF